jgi:hypothetical protein
MELNSHRGGPDSRPGLVKWGLWWTKWRWGKFSPSTSVSPANIHATKISILTLTRAGTVGQKRSTRRPGFAPGSGQVGFVVDKVALEQVFSE